MWAFAIRNREPVLGGIVVFIALMVASALGEAWQEAVVGGITVGILIWVAKTSDHAKHVTDIKRVVNGGG